MKIYSSSHTYEHPWATVALAFWKKYPNPTAKHVESVDVVRRDFDAASGQLTTQRVFRGRPPFSLPSCVKSTGLVPDYHLVAAEHTVVDAQQSRLQVRSTNVNFLAGTFQLDESCEYSVHPENANWTLYRHEARIRANTGFLSGMVESYSVSSLAEQAKRGLSTMEQLCRQVSEEYQADLKRFLQPAAPALPAQP